MNGDNYLLTDVGYAAVGRKRPSRVTAEGLTNTKGKWFHGQHAAIIDQAIWDEVQGILAQNNRQRIANTWHRRKPEASVYYSPRTANDSSL